MNIIHGDCVSTMAGMAESSVDAIATDPPYGLEFMGKEWDKLSAKGGPAGLDFLASTPRPSCPSQAASAKNVAVWHEQRLRMQAWHHRWAVEALRVLKPGGHLAAMGGTRTVHRLMVALEDAGFEIRDTIQWQRLEDGYELVGVDELPPEEAFE